MSSFFRKLIYNAVIFDVFTAVTMKNAVFIIYGSFLTFHNCEEPLFITVVPSRMYLTKILWNADSEDTKVNDSLSDLLYDTGQIWLYYFTLRCCILLLAVIICSFILQSHSAGKYYYFIIIIGGAVLSP
jgi:hypothetical protein